MRGIGDIWRQAAGKWSGAVEATLIGLQRVPPETLRSSKMFGEQVEVADDASTQDRLLAYAGRTP